MIVKIQTPLHCSKPGEEVALVYNKDKSYEVQCRITPSLINFVGSGNKCFAEIEPKTPIKILKKLPDQGW